MHPMPSGIYRCVYESGDGHTEHHYNFFRAFTEEEKKAYFREDEDAEWIGENSSRPRLTRL
jgi:hypothetical protein